jgi:hypothetical protein
VLTRAIPVRILFFGLFLAAACASESEPRGGPPARGGGAPGKADGTKYSCEGSCGEQAPGGCWCDEECVEYGDCCADKAPVCEGRWPSCEGLCGGPSPDGCWCDEACTDFGDCCVDVAPACQDVPSCEGACGGESADGCGCDDGCAARGDCCADVEPVCGGMADLPMLELLREVPAGTRWADLDPALRAVLEVKARRQQKTYRDAFAFGGLREKVYDILETPTPEMLAAFDDHVRRRFVEEVPEDYAASSQMESPALLAALETFYVYSLAVARNDLILYKGLAPVDWDGVSRVEGIPIPDRFARDDLRAYGEELLADVRAIDDDGLAEVERAVLGRLTDYVRTLRAGSLTGVGWGGADMEAPYLLIYRFDDLVASRDPARTGIYQSDDLLLEHANAIVQAPMKWVDVGTVFSTVAYNWTQVMNMARINAIIGDTTASEVGKDYLLLVGWWRERLEAHPDAGAHCTIYSDAERAGLFESFSADMFFNRDGEHSLESYQSILGDFGASLAGRYQDYAVEAVAAVFPGDGDLDPAARAQVEAAIRAAPLGAIQTTITSSLTDATGSPDAAQRFTAAMATLQFIGGYTDPNAPVRPEEIAATGAMWEEVKDFLAARYDRDGFELRSRVPATVTINAGPSTFSHRTLGITIGLGPRRSRAQLYSTLIHEAHHAINYSGDALVQGLAWEGAAVQAERQLLDPFLRHALAADPGMVPLYFVDFIVREARFTGTTAATLGVFLRDSCEPGSSPSTIEFAKQIAAGWGLPADALEMAALRAHRGTQYLQYIWGELMFRDLIGYLEEQIQPGVDNGIDPYDLAVCEMPFPARDPAAAARLAACLGL